MPKPQLTTVPASPKSTLPMPKSMDVAMREMNEKVIYVRDRSVIAEIAPHRILDHKIPLISCNVFKNEAYADHRAGKLSVAQHWLAWPHRRVVNNLVYSPNQPRITTSSNLNTWFPSTSKPRKGDISLFLEYMTGMMKNDAKYYDWVMAWLAFHLQRPEVKMLTGVMFWSHEQGNGKSTLGWIMRQIYGEHNSFLIRTKFPERFNSHAENKQFGWIDELTPIKKAGQSDDVKSMITQSRILIENKQQRPYEMPDLISYYFTSNYPNALDLSAEDRRFFVHNVGANGLTKDWLEKTLHPWLNTQAAIDAIHYHLLNEIDLSKPIIGGNPDSLDRAPFVHTRFAPRNSARLQMIADNRDDIESWLHELAETPENILVNANHHWTIFSSEELFKLYREQTDDKKLGIQAFRIRMSGVLAKLCKGQPLQIDGFETARPRLYTSDPAKVNLDMPQIREIVAKERSTGLVPAQV